MRVLVFFDLPTETAQDRREYRKLRKFLIRGGFLMMQESVYSKLVLNQQSATLIKLKLKKSLPSAGLVQVLTVTEKQYASIENFVGTVSHKEVNTMDRLVIL